MVDLVREFRWLKDEERERGEKIRVWRKGGMCKREEEV